MELLNEYAQIINLALFATIIGWLFHISRLSRTSLIDQYTAKLAAKDQEIVSLRSQLNAKESQYESQLAVIEHSRAFFERFVAMQGDERIDALKLEYQMRMEQLEKREMAIEQEIEKAVSSERKILEGEIASIRSERKILQGETKQILSVDKETISKVIDITSSVLRFAMRI